MDTFPNEQGQRPLIETRLDTYGNRWFYFLTAPKVYSIFHTYPQTNQAVITAEGKRVLSKIDRREILHRIASDSLVSDLRPLGKGGESTVKKVYDAVSHLRKMLGDYQVRAVEKRIHNQYVQSALGWEIVQFLDHIRPVVTSHGFQLIRPLGATNTTLFLPYYEGVTLDKFITSLHRGQSELNISMDKISSELHYALVASVKDFMETKGFERYRKGKQLWDNDPDEFQLLNSSETVKVGALVDIHPHVLSSVGRYKNWIVPKHVARKVKDLAKSNIDEAIKVLKDGVVIFDPIFLKKV